MKPSVQHLTIGMEELPLKKFENLIYVTPSPKIQISELAKTLSRSSHLAIDTSCSSEHLILWGDSSELKTISNHKDVENTRLAFQDPIGNLIILTNEIIVNFKPNSSENDRKILLRSIDGKISRKCGSQYIVKLSSAEPDAPITTSNEISKNSIVNYCEPNSLLPITLDQAPQSEPMFGKQWYLQNVGQDGGTPGADISALGAWNLTKGSSEIRIIIIDLAFDIQHPELIGNFDPGKDFSNNNNPLPFISDNHGTSCAGLIAAAVNGVGITGIAPNCRIVPAKVAAISTAEQMAEAFNWAAMNGKIISCSLGFAPSNTVNLAVTEAAAKGVVTFGSAGNNHTNQLHFPGSATSAICVGASNNFDTRASFSNFGSGLDFVAPGEGGSVNLLSTDPQGTQGQNNKPSPDGDFTAFGGTSAATPLAAGVAGLMLSICPDLTPENIRNILRETADKIDPTAGHYDANGRSIFFGSGRINAKRAVHRALKFKKSIAGFSSNPYSYKRSIYAITSTGRLAQIWDSFQWNVDFPAELAGHAELTFLDSIAVFPTAADVHKKSIFSITQDGTLVQIWDTDKWNIDFPATLAGHPNIKFQKGLAVFPINASNNKKSIYAITSDGRLAQITDEPSWTLDFPAEKAGHNNLRFDGGISVFPTNASANKKTITALTIDGRLAQIWDTKSKWHLDFPAELAGHNNLRFKGDITTYARNSKSNKKTIIAITTDGRLAQIWDTSSWNLDFPAEQLGGVKFEFKNSGISAFPTDIPSNKKSIYAISKDGRLTQLWDTTQWNLDFPSNRVGAFDLRFSGQVLALPALASQNLKSVFAITDDGRLTQHWDGNQWHLDFPAELA